MTEVDQALICTLLVTATLLPLGTFVALIVLTRRVIFRQAGAVATAVMSFSFLLSLVALFKWIGAGDDAKAFAWNVPWIPIPGTGDGYLYLGALIDSVTIAMMVMVSLVSALVHMYSIGYMAGDKRYNWFFAYLSLFTFSMMGIVISNSVTQLLVGWELVGLTSYLLIGFWFEKRGPQLACKKAWVMNRIGDAGFLIGFGILFWQVGGKLLLPAVGEGEAANMFVAIRALIEADGHHSIANPPLWLTVAGIGLFFGAIGKSAQFPLHTWLPDAMEGPTPVSSIVHSATMVAAGVYLTGRIYPILTPDAHLFISIIGLITLVMGAAMAMVMTDIKRVLAYSTLSQLGYMILGMGTGAYIFAIYHLIMHAFFKCCLFQCSGSVIHAAHHQQDMRHYGGLGRKLPITMLCYGVCTLAIAGASIPYTSYGISGFYSKDGIIAGAYNYSSAMVEYGFLGSLFFWGPLIIAYVTPFYMARSFALTFLGKPRDQYLYDHAHEAPPTMYVPQLILAFMAVVSGWFLWRGMIVDSADAMTAAGATMVQSTAEIHAGEENIHGPLLHGCAWLIMIGLGLLMYRNGFGISNRIVNIKIASFKTAFGRVNVKPIKVFYLWAYNKFYFDALYDVFAIGLCKLVAIICGLFDKIIVDGRADWPWFPGIVNGFGWLGRLGALIAGWVDDKFIDAAANNAAMTAQGWGQLLRTTQPGRVRVYVLLMIASGALVMLVVVTTAIVMQ